MEEKQNNISQMYKRSKKNTHMSHLMVKRIDTKNPYALLAPTYMAHGESRVLNQCESVKRN